MDVQYPVGSVVWARLEGGRWWPGQVAADTECPDVVETLRKPPLAIVKFFDEDFYHIVNNSLHIYPFECDKKEEFLKRGKEFKGGGKDNFSLRLKFEADISKAEAIWASTNPIKPTTLNTTTQNKSTQNKSTQNKSTPNKSTPNKTTPNESKTAEKSLSQKLLTRCSYMKMAEAERFDYNIEHEEEPQPSIYEPFLRKSDELGMPRIRKQPSTPRAEDMVYNCDTCGFQTSRIDNIVRHHKSHSDPYRFHPAKEFGPTFVFEKLTPASSRRKSAKGLPRSDGKVKKTKTPRKRLIDKPFPIYRKSEPLLLPKKRTLKDGENNATPKRRRTKSKEPSPPKVPFSNPFEEDELEEERMLKEQEEGENKKSKTDEGGDKMANLLDDIDDMEESQDLDNRPKPVIVEWEEFIKDSTVKPPLMNDDNADSSSKTSDKIENDEGDSKKEEESDDECMSPILMGEESDKEKSEKEMPLPSGQKTMPEQDNAIEMADEEKTAKDVPESVFTPENTPEPMDEDDDDDDSVAVSDAPKPSPIKDDVDDLAPALDDEMKEAKDDIINLDDEDESANSPEILNVEEQPEKQIESEKEMKIVVDDKLKDAEEEESKDGKIVFHVVSDSKVLQESEAKLDMPKTSTIDSKLPEEDDIESDDSNSGCSSTASDVIITRKFVPSPIKESCVEIDSETSCKAKNKEESDAISSPTNLVVREQIVEESSIVANDSPLPSTSVDSIVKHSSEDVVKENCLSIKPLQEIKEALLKEDDKSVPQSVISTDEPLLVQEDVEISEVPVQDLQEQVDMCNVIQGDEIVLADNDMSTCEIVVGEPGLQPNEIVVGDEIEVQEIEIADDGIQPNEIVIGEEIMIQPMEVPLVVDPSDGLNNIQNNGHTIIENPQTVLASNQCTPSNIVIDENTSIIYSSGNILDSTIISLPKTTLSSSSKDIPITLTSEQQLLLSNRMTAFNKPHYANAIISDASAQDEVTVLTSAATDNVHHEKQTVFNMQQEFRADASSLESRSSGIATASADFLVHQ